MGVIHLKKYTHGMCLHAIYYLTEREGSIKIVVKRAKQP